MNSTKPGNYLTNRYFFSFLILVLAISINVLFTFNINDTKIRIGLSDLIIPIYILFVIIPAYIKIRFPDLIVENFWLWIFLMTIWMLVSLINGYYDTGKLMQWAVVNKFFGWILLILYLIVGAYIGAQDNKLKLMFLRWMIIIVWIISLYEICIRFFDKFGYHAWFLPLHYRIEGFYDNPNAFGISVAATLILHVYLQTKYKIFNRYISTMGAVFCVMAVLYSYSRSAWLGLIIGVIVLLITFSKSIKNILIISILSVLLTYIMFSYINNTQFHAILNTLEKMVKYEKNESKINNAIDFIGNNYVKVEQYIVNISTIHINLSANTATNGSHKKTSATNKIIQPAEAISINKNKIQIYNPDLMYRLKGNEGSSNVKRIEMLKRSYSYWLDHPLMGIGLGSYRWKCIKDKVSSDAITIHNSALWLLVETGLIGLLIFCWIIFKVMKSLIQNNYSGDSISLAKAMICVIGLFVGASIGTEVLYQRYFWLLLGISLVDLNKLEIKINNESVN